MKQSKVQNSKLLDESTKLKSNSTAQAQNKSKQYCFSTSIVFVELKLNTIVNYLHNIWQPVYTPQYLIISKVLFVWFMSYLFVRKIRAYFYMSQYQLSISGFCFGFVISGFCTCLLYWLSVNICASSNYFCFVSNMFVSDFCNYGFGFSLPLT